ncbi:MAG: hypothetical protein KGL35_28815 [Bradyrhizobium sp.]|nr:hypothetical protein [Bradyrhizobium sp.]
MTTLPQLLRHFERELAKAGGLSAWGERHGFTPGYLSQIRYGSKSPSPRLCATLGYREVKQEVRRVYEKIDQ